MSDEFTERAREMLRDKLLNHQDSGVRLLAEMADIPADHPSVVKIAAALRERAASS